MEGPPRADVLSELEWRGMVYQTTDPDLGAKLAAERFTVYVGIDATADSLHVGGLLTALALQRFQQAGHRPIAVLGGATTRIGDPSGRSTERRLLSVEEIEANAAGIRRQLEAFVDLGGGPALPPGPAGPALPPGPAGPALPPGPAGPAGGLLLDNADWLKSLTLTDFLRDVGKHFTVNSMIAKESVRARLTEREQGISYTEFSYMLLQAYDYLHLHDVHGCRLQAGGSDQWGNITAGIDLIRRTRGAEAYGLTWPLLTKADGTKFGKSESGNVWLDPARTSPYQFFQFWLRTEDRDALDYLRLFTSLGREEIGELEADVAERPERRRAQEVLAHQLTTAVHGEEAAVAARQAAEALYGGDLAVLDEATLTDLFSEAPSLRAARTELAGGGVGLVDLLVRTGLAPSRSAARSTIDAGGAYLNNRRETDPERRVGEGDLLRGGYVVLRRGKRNHSLVRFV